LSGELVRATAAELQLRTDLSGELVRATAAELQLRTDLSGELVRATAAELQLQTDLSGELVRATAAELQLRTDLSGEIVRASNAEAVLTQNAQWVNIVPCNQATYADELAPMVLPVSIYNSYRVDGWYLKNPVDGTCKSNWYLPSYGLTMGDLEYVSFAYFPIASTLNISRPYLTIYTKPTGTGDTTAWYHAKYTMDNFTRPSALSRTYVYGAINGSSTLSVPSLPGYTSVQGTSSNVSPSATWGSWNASEQILFISLSAGDSGNSSVAGAFEFILSEVNLILANGTISNKFTNDSVINMYTAAQVSALYAYLFDTSSNIVAPPLTDHTTYIRAENGSYANHNFNITNNQATTNYTTV
jgi:hypothetical protein